jgi:hypothetical protein
VQTPPGAWACPRPKRRDYVYLTHGQVLALATEAGRGCLLVLLLAYTGLRWGEATALCVCDIDFERRRAFSDVGAASYWAPRNPSSPGPCRCPGSSPPRSQGPSPVSTPTSSCSPCPAAASCDSPTGVAQFSYPPAAALVSAAVSGFTTFATRPRRNFQAGYPPKMLQEIMGHASIATTLDLYGHLYPGGWTTTLTASTRRPGCLIRTTMRPKCGQMAMGTSRTRND